MMLLYQLSIRLLGLDSPESVIHAALGLLHERTKAAVVGFLWVTDEGELEPKLVIPAEAAPRVTLNPSLTAMVLKQGRAVWVANQGASAEHGAQYADALCAPLVRRGPDGKRDTLGAIHVYLADGRFRQSEFDFAISVANIAAVALARARRVSALESDNRRLAAHEPGADDLIGNSDKMQRLKTK
jgi:GAF domain-containing protein